MRERHILVIDSDQDRNRLIEATLRKARCNVSRAFHLDHGREKFRKFSFDAVVCAQHVGGANCGYRFLTEARKLDRIATLIQIDEDSEMSEAADSSIRRIAFRLSDLTGSQDALRTVLGLTAAR